MKSIGRTSCVLILLAMAGQAQADTSLDHEVEHYLENNSGAAAEPNTFRAHWKGGIRLDSADGNFKIAMGGRVMFDMNFADSDAGLGGDLGENKVGFRRVRMYFSGTIHKKTVFKLQLDFAKPAVALKDVYVGLTDIGPGTLLFGHMKEPFGLNELTSSKYITFTERAASSQAFAPARNSGIGYFSALGENKQFYLAGGTFFPTGDDGTAAGQGGWGFVARFGWTAIENRDKDMLLWVGVDFRWQNYRITGQQARYRARVNSFGDRQIDTQNINAESDIRYAFELAFRMKSIHISAEFFWATPKMVTGDDPTLSGWYAQVGWFITGESRPFKKTQGGWSRVKPKANFWTGEGGKGAWELAVRWDSTDLTDKQVTGGEMNSLSASLNWYWNPNARVMLAYVNTDVTDGLEGTGKLNYVIIRWQIDF